MEKGLAQLKKQVEISNNSANSGDDNSTPQNLLQKRHLYEGNSAQTLLRLDH
jgi:hypothetical protein